MMNELKVLQKCSHPHIIKVTELLEDEENYYIVSELLEGGELFERLVKMEKRYDETKAAFIVKQVLLALNYMHQMQITHRDLKPENILFEYADDDNLNLKIADFGFSCYFDPKEGLDTTLGSP